MIPFPGLGHQNEPAKDRSGNKCRLSLRATPPLLLKQFRTQSQEISCFSIRSLMPRFLASMVAISSASQESCHAPSRLNYRRRDNGLKTIDLRKPDSLCNGPSPTSPRFRRELREIRTLTRFSPEGPEERSIGHVAAQPSLETSMISIESQRVSTLAPYITCLSLAPLPKVDSDRPEASGCPES